jgi:H+/gluconate symporter-like permease
MTWILTLLLILWSTWSAYKHAHQNGTWSTSRFIKLLISAWVACAILALIIVFVFRSEIMQAHEVLSMSVILLACLGMVVLITLFAKRLKSRN